MDSISNVQVLSAGKQLAGMSARSAMPRLLNSTAVDVQHLPNKKGQLTWNAQQYPVVMIRDAQTGEVRGFLRGGSASIEDEPADMEIQVSDGIHGSVLRTQRLVQ